MHTILVFLALLLSFSVHAEDMEHSTITSCAYQGGTAREIQTIRQTEGHDWLEFEKQINQIYRQGQGRQDLLAIAKVVYQQPLTATPASAYDNAFSLCVKRTKEAALKSAS